MGLKYNPRERDNTIYATVLASDGKIRVAVPEGTEGSIKREYATDEDKKSGNDKKGILSGVKHEMVYTELSGVITEMKFHDGDYGTNLQIVVTDPDADEDEKPVTLSLSTESNFGEDVMKKLPNINLKKPVTFTPYSFDNDRGKKVRGITIVQGEKKIENFYIDGDKKPINGYPKAPTPKAGKSITTPQWRKFFAEAREFLMEDLVERDLVKEAGESDADKDYNAL